MVHKVCNTDSVSVAEHLTGGKDFLAGGRYRGTGPAYDISKYSRSQVIAKRVLYKRKPAATVAVCPAAAHKTVEVKGAKNGGTRLVAAAKAPRFYAAEDVALPKKNRKHA
ncbi:hypothetical protein BGZ95_001056, partial [Linnemannia exigua]